MPCAVISSPVHVQDFPARYAPQMGLEGANVMFDTWIHPLMMGLEEHLIGMFREDFEFHVGATPSHLGGHAPAPVAVAAPAAVTVPSFADTTASAPTAPTAPAVPPTPAGTATAPTWSTDAERELGKIPFFVRGKARRNTERFAFDRGLSAITVETLYDAKAHFSR
jgi:light-independent protochlorophyllide reductase subunit B